MAKLTGKLTNTVVVLITLASWNSFKSPVFGSNLGIKANMERINDNVVEKLQKIDSLTQDLQNLATNLNFNYQETQTETTNSDQNLVNLHSFTFGFPQTSHEKSIDYLAFMTQTKTKSKKDFSEIEVGDLTKQKFQLSAKNFLNYIANSIKQIRTDKPTNISKSSDIATLPQTKADEVFKDMYDFDINLPKKEYDLNSSMGEIFNNQENNTNNQNNSSPISSPIDNLGNKSNNSNQYEGLQQQLIASVEVTRTNSSPRATPSVPNNSGFTPRVNVRNNWFQYYSIGQQYSNPGDLINSNQNSVVTRQQALKQQVEQEIKQKMPFAQTQNQRGFNYP